MNTKTKTKANSKSAPHPITYVVYSTQRQTGRRKVYAHGFDRETVFNAIVKAMDDDPHYTDFELVTYRMGERERFHGSVKATGNRA